MNLHKCINLFEVASFSNFGVLIIAHFHTPLLQND